MKNKIPYTPSIKQFLFLLHIDENMKVLNRPSNRIAVQMDMASFQKCVLFWRDDILFLLKYFDLFIFQSLNATVLEDDLEKYEELKKR